MTRRFADDVRSLDRAVVKKLEAVIGEIHSFGPRHPPLHTRRIERNPDGRFHFINVDNKYRIVAALEGSAVLLEKVGNHDETLAWGERATLREYEERLKVEFPSNRRTTRIQEERVAEPLLIEQKVSLPQLFQQTELLSDLITGDVYGSLEGYRDGLIEDWMIFLSPLQRRAVDRAVHGPARITGGPGTGKTVVGLHRAVQFAKDYVGPGRVLMTSFVQNVPEVLRGLYARLASPELHDRTVFRTIHSIAGQVLAERGRALRIDEPAARARFTHALDASANRRTALARAGFGEQYLWDEVTRIIEGRAVSSVDEYVRVTRHGRRQRMNEPERRLLWSVYAEYRDACDRTDPPIASWGRHLVEARSALASEPATRLYDAIVVDEAQDITEVGIRLLTDLLRGGPAGQIVLIGDNAQRIYPGGFRLADLGLEVRGRSFSLNLCYRSTEQIMKAAAALGRYVSTEEFGEEALREQNWAPARTGARPTLREFRTLDDEQAWVAGELRSNPDLLDATAVLVPTNNLKDIWKRVLIDARIELCDLLGYKGRPTPGVKVGTYNRAKGLEFKRVILPNLSDKALRADAERLDELITKGSQLFVAMTRARDRVDMSYSGTPCLYVDALLDSVDVV